MTPNEVAGFVALGGLLGVAGQGARVVVGLTKSMRSAKSAGNKGGKARWFDGKRFAISLFIGAVAGMLGFVTLWGGNIDRGFMFSIVTIGYSGTDFIEGFVRGES